MQKTLQPYLSVITARFRTLLQYRAAAFAGIITQIFWGVIRLMVLFAFFKLRPDNQPMTMPELVAYVARAFMCCRISKGTITVRDQ